MEKPVKGDIVIIPFPFSDLSETRKRPAFVAANLKGNDIILCQITSKNVNDSYSLKISQGEFKEGTLQQESNIRPNKIFTADKSIVLYKAGSLKQEKTKAIIEKICEILRN